MGCRRSSGVGRGRGRGVAVVVDAQANVVRGPPRSASLERYPDQRRYPSRAFRHERGLSSMMWRLGTVSPKAKLFQPAVWARISKRFLQGPKVLSQLQLVAPRVRNLARNSTQLQAKIL